MNRKRLNICRKKQWHAFKVQGVKRKRRASLGFTTGVGSICSVREDIKDEAERLLAISKGGRNAAKEGHDDEELENAQEVDRDGTDPYNEVIFRRRRPDSVVIDCNRLGQQGHLCWN